jgi:peptidoglycan/xylan/chitin deacetylase (PgdA/CDA1 family)
VTVEVCFSIQVDCEATQRAVNDPALGARAITGLGALFAEHGLRGTFAVIPGDLCAHAALYRALMADGHEVGLHVHPGENGHPEYLGLCGPEEQEEILEHGIVTFGEVLGMRPLSFTPGYYSANDYTFPALEALGFRHGTVSLPTRDLPQCASIWGSAPLDAHYPHRYCRSLCGDVDFVEIPPTVDPSTRMWGGAHPLDLRIELVDAKNHRYTLQKAIQRLLEAGDRIPVKVLKATTHNVFDFSDPRDFRRETLLGVVQAARELAERAGCRLIPATTAEIAARYRAANPLPPRCPAANASPSGAGEA